jgi:hypothetical protein
MVTSVALALVAPLDVVVGVAPGAAVHAITTTSAADAKKR